MDKNGNGCIDNSDVAWFQAAYDLYGDLDWDHAFKRTLTLNASFDLAELTVNIEV